MTTQTITSRPVTFAGVMKAGLIAGFVAALINVAWYYIALTLGSVAPPAFIGPVVFSSVVPVLVGAALYYLLVRFTSRGRLIWLILATVFVLLSIIPTFGTELPDGSPAPEGFTLLTLPMHIFGGIVAIFIIPRFSK